MRPIAVHVVSAGGGQEPVFTHQPQHPVLPDADPVRPEPYAHLPVPLGVKRALFEHRIPASRGPTQKPRDFFNLVSSSP